MEESLHAIVTQKSFIDRFRCSRGSHWQISCRQSLRQTHDVRSDGGVFAGKHAPGPAEACEHFIRDHQGSIFVAELTHSFQKFTGPYNHATSALKHRLDNHRSDAFSLRA